MYTCILCSEFCVVFHICTVFRASNWCSNQTPYMPNYAWKSLIMLENAYLQIDWSCWFVPSSQQLTTVTLCLSHVYFTSPCRKGSLIPRPPPFLPFVCVHNNTQEWKTSEYTHCRQLSTLSPFFSWSFTPVYCCECKWTVKTGVAWEWGYRKWMCVCV